MGVIPGWAFGIGFVVVVVVVVTSLAFAILRKLGLDPPPGADTGEQRQTLEALHKRVTELEERVDFAERLLATKGEADRLPSPPSVS